MIPKGADFLDKIIRINNVKKTMSDRTRSDHHLGCGQRSVSSENIRLPDSTAAISPRSGGNPAGVRHALCFTLACDQPAWLAMRCRACRRLRKCDDHTKCDHTIYCPPLIVSVEPVMKPDSSATRNTTQRATSSGSPSRRTGMSGRTDFSKTSAGTAFTISVAI